MSEEKRDPSPVERVRNYRRAKRRLAGAELAGGLGYLLIWLAVGWAPLCRGLSATAAFGPAVQFVICGVILAMGYEILMIPLTVFSGYVIEKRHGLLRQTFKSWVWDQVKSEVVGLVLLTLALILLYASYGLGGRWWWVLAGGGFTLFFVFLAQLAPVAILPLFYTFSPLPPGPVADRLWRLCRKAKARVAGIYVWGLSEKTPRANAGLMGLGPTRRVVLSDSLLQRFNPSEIEVVLAHELGHHRYAHMRWLLALQSVLTFPAFYLADVLVRLVGPMFGVARAIEPAGLPLTALSFLVVGLVAVPLYNTMSRFMERQADRYALTLTGLPGSFISAIERLAVVNQADFSPHPAVEFLFHSHPAPSTRIRMAKEFHRERTAETS